jgi:hypothetical protein
MASSVKEALAQSKNDVAEMTARAAKIRAKVKLHNINKLFSALQQAEPQCSIYIGTYSVGITVPVKSMKHMLEVIEAAEIVVGFEFDHSFDNAGSGQRIFNNKSWENSWLSIIAQVTTQDDPDAPALCHRVIERMETIERPVYALECLE